MDRMNRILRVSRFFRVVGRIALFGWVLTLVGVTVVMTWGELRVDGETKELTPLGTLLAVIALWVPGAILLFGLKIHYRMHCTRLGPIPHGAICDTNNEV